ncbi:MAG: DNA-processing protein DprA [Cyanobacteriota bacterium erpe_2018_sw_39hr_WHONDRS-SW48-000098_B_bin.30]|nr:DNA-processing protein DprA [Cyanobacteriota bacterium erpe_2018_sw_39hr_WHONDRS-SW48-000098_B_bin.30]
MTQSMEKMNSAFEWRDEETLYWVALDQSQIGLGFRKLQMIYDRLGSMERFWQADPLDLQEMGTDTVYGLPFLTEEVIGKFLKYRQSTDPAQLVAKLEEADTRAYPYPHPGYPSNLRQIYDAPAVLYVRGKLDLSVLVHSVGIVGTRNPTSYGQTQAKKFSKELAARNVPVVSGMAFGVDSFSHWGAIEAGGRPGAVLGGGPDHCYPSSNKPLYNKMVELPTCAVVSEYFPGTSVQKWMFPARNRIISGITEGLLVIEAGRDSGSLITARQAFDQSRLVFALPGRIDSPMSVGTNELISANTAKLVSSVDQILAEFSWVVGKAESKPKIVELFGREKELFDLVCQEAEAVHFDKLSQLTGMSAGELSSGLTMLELAGVVERLPGDYYQRT